MKESELNGKSRDRIIQTCPRVVIYKIADRFTSGIPDTVLTWEEFTSWLEFKLLDPNESIHDQLDGIQLVNLIRLEQTARRAWVIAFRRGNVKRGVSPKTIIYRPTALYGGKMPLTERPADSSCDFMRELTQRGVVEFEGFDHRAIAALILFTHVATY